MPMKPTVIQINEEFFKYPETFVAQRLFNLSYIYMNSTRLVMRDFLYFHSNVTLLTVTNSSHKKEQTDCE